MKKKHLIKVLRWTAQRLYMGEREAVAPGLCYTALRWYGWDAMCALEEAIKPYTITRGRFARFLCRPYDKWEQRAMFALLLAESLEKGKTK
jgi:hypothetical protein